MGGAGGRQVACARLGKQPVLLRVTGRRETSVHKLNSSATGGESPEPTPTIGLPERRQQHCSPPAALPGAGGRA